MATTRHEQLVLQAPDGHDIQLQVWRPTSPAIAAIQILHGLGEHSDRYARFAQAATDRGFIVYCHDHRGHGKQAEQIGYFANTDGWSLVVSDANAVHQNICRRHADLPILLVGHSMGSYIAQSFLIRHSPRIAGLILSASTWPSRPLLLPAMLLAKIEGWRVGKHRSSALLNWLGVGNLNNSFKPTRTASDWLSRDASEVDKFIEDPFCGGPYTTGLWSDLTAGLFAIASDKALLRIPADLPIMITGGDVDPVGGDKGMTKLALHYAQTGHQRLRVKLYADGRHEMLNETNRDEVTRDWLDWLLATSRNAR